MYADHNMQLLKQKEWYIKNRPEILKRRKLVKQNQTKYIQNIKQKSGCIICGENEPCCLDFHHKNEKNKLASISDMIRNRVTDKKILLEIKKCVILCSNCHRKVHAGLIKL
jgi:hypothetical protein